MQDKTALGKQNQIYEESAKPTKGQMGKKQARGEAKGATEKKRPKTFGGWGWEKGERKIEAMPQPNALSQTPKKKRGGVSEKKQ